VKETAFSGVFPLVQELKAQGAVVSVHDPMYSPAELSAIGFEWFALGTAVDVVVVQADHKEYAALSAADVPEAQVIVDGRRVLDPARLAPARIIRIGSG
jgi:UDP-N-acetyl-D-mannosaminuronate dehydrogenase